MKRVYTKEDLRAAWIDGYSNAQLPDEDSIGFDECFKSRHGQLDTDKKIQISYLQIRLCCGWETFCDVTDHLYRDLYTKKITDHSVFDVLVSDAKKLGLIK